MPRLSYSVADLMILLKAGVILAILMLPLLYAQQRDNNTITECQKPGAVSTQIHGTVRIAGPDYYLYNNQWYVLAPVCQGRNTHQCLQARNGESRVLAEQVGQPVQATLCNGRIVAFQVAGLAFDKNRP